jgi:hypothetical protein
MGGTHRRRVVTAMEPKPVPSRVAGGASDERCRGGPVVRGVRAVWRRMGWGCNRVVPCRDARGQAARLLIHHGHGGVVLSVSAAGPVQLTLRQARRLQTALRRAGHDDDRRVGRGLGPGAGR